MQTSGLLNLKLSRLPKVQVDMLSGKVITTKQSVSEKRAIEPYLCS